MRAVQCLDVWQVQGVNDRVQLAAGARRAEPAAAGALDARRGDGRRPRDDLGGRGGPPGPRRRAAPGHPAARGDARRRRRRDRPGHHAHGRRGRRGRDGGADARQLVGDRPERDGGPVRLPASRRPARPARQDRHVRRGQERRDRRGQQGAAPDLRRRRDDRRGVEHRRVVGVRQLRRRAQAAHGRRLPRAHGLGHDVHRTARRRRRRLHRRRHGAAARRPAGALAVSAGSQRTIEGWVEKNRPGTPAAEAAGRYRSGASSDTGPDDGRGGPPR